MKKTKQSILLLLCILSFALFAIGSGSSSSEATKVGEVEKESEESEKANDVQDSKESTSSKVSDSDEIKDEYHVGDKLNYKGLEVTYVESSYYESDNQFLQPTDGNQFIRLVFHVDNNSGSDKAVSVYEFNCYADGYECEKTYGDDDLSASLSDGRSADGAVYFEIPQNANNIEIEYEFDMFNDKKAKFVFEGDKNSGLSFEASSTQSEEVYHAGDIIETKDARIVYTKCGEYTSDNSFLNPKDGNRYIYIELEIENTSDHDQTVSYFSFTCYADGSSCDGFYGMDDALSATLSPGRKANGTVAFEVPKTAQNIEIEYEDNMWTQNKLVFLYED
ncbi:MAG: DUF4352 domain-containing protein [Lachnospiraceae bacterium]|nr:DUF4352 domain-containing protein [Lachnospiraceae bacterium]